MTLPTKHRLLATLFASPIYRLALGNRVPKTLNAVSLENALSAEAAWYADGLFPAREIPETETRNDFRWLADTPDPGQVWPVINTWISAHVNWDPIGWRADNLGERLVRWLSVFDAVAAPLGTEERSDWAGAIGRGATHLGRAPLSDVAPWRRFLVHQGRIAAALALPEREHTLAETLRTFGADADRQILSDGGHAERSPAKALAVLAILCDIRDTLVARHVEPPSGLISAIDRMVPFLKAVSFSDGGFALIGGTTAQTSALISAVVAASGAKGRAMSSAPHTGFHRLRAGQTTVILDCGETSIAGPAHRAPASFELASGKTRIIGNCGTRLTSDGAQQTWTKALASTAAHAALVINDTDAGAVTEARVDRREHEGARLIEAEHDGYAALFGIRHRRSIYLDAGGGDLRGEDVLYGGQSQPFSIRFHLYPDVRASMVAGGGEVIVKPPKGRGWRFQSRHPVRLEESVSFFDGRQHRAQQIVVLGNHEPGETMVKWRFSQDG